MSETKPITEMLDEIQGRADATTAGPLDTGANSYQIINQHGVVVAEMMTSTSHERDADAVFFAAARADVPKLVEALRVAMEWVTEEDEIRYIQAILSKP